MVYLTDRLWDLNMKSFSSNVKIFKNIDINKYMRYSPLFCFFDWWNNFFWLKFNSVWTALCSWVLRKHCHILRYSSSQTFSQFKAQKTNLMTSRSRVGPYIINLAQQNIGPFQYWICPPFSKSKIVFHVWSKPGNSCVSCPSLSPTWRTGFKLCHVWALGSNYKLSPTLHLITIRLTSIENKKLLF